MAMRMKRCTAAILLVLSLEALVAGRLSAAVADDGVDTIRLPSHGLADANGGEKKRPWKCCDVPRCTRSIPPKCQCQDKVKKCAGTCKVCEKDDASSRFVCRDSYVGEPGPSCTRLLNGTEEDVSTGKAEVVSKTSVVADGEEKAAPWKCCDDSLCTRSQPPTCFCRDKVKKCAKACKVCEKADGASSRYVCRDSYSRVSPRCTKI